MYSYRYGSHGKKLAEVEYMGQWLRTITYCKVVNKLRSESGKPTFVPLDDIDIVRDSSRRGSRRKHPESRTAGSGQQGTGDTRPKCKHVFFLAKIERMPYKTDSHDAQHITVDGQLPCRIRHGVPSQTD